jgi:hypothetical protein
MQERRAEQSLTCKEEKPTYEAFQVLLREDKTDKMSCGTKAELFHSSVRE